MGKFEIITRQSLNQKLKKIKRVIQKTNLPWAKNKIGILINFMSKTTIIIYNLIYLHKVEIIIFVYLHLQRNIICKGKNTLYEKILFDFSSLILILFISLIFYHNLIKLITKVGH